MLQDLIGLSDYYLHVLVTLFPVLSCIFNCLQSMEMKNKEIICRREPVVSNAENRTRKGAKRLSSDVSRSSLQTTEQVVSISGEGGNKVTDNCEGTVS